MKRKAIIVLILSALTLLTLSACNFTGLHIVTGSGKIVEETRQVSNFDAVDFSGSGDLIITQGDQEGLRIEADENIMPYLRSEVRNHTLHIYLDSANFLSIEASRQMHFYVTMKDVSSLDLSGSGKITSDKIATKDLNIDVSGSGEVEIKDLKADSLSLDMSGSGSCNISGEAADQSLTISGSGSCDASDLASKNVEVDISGSGRVRVNAADTLKAHISGSGDVRYRGTPKITENITGSGGLFPE